MSVEKLFNWNNIRRYDFEKTEYDNIWAKNLYCHPIIRKDMWKKEMLRLLEDEEVSK